MDNVSFLAEHGMSLGEIKDLLARGLSMEEIVASVQRREPARPLLTPMSAVEAKKPSYLISPYLPRGMLAIMGGISGSGKTYLALSWAAAISNGQRLPFQDWTSPTPPSGYVFYFTQENDPNTVVRPRLDLLRANLDKILIQYQDGKTTYDPLTMNDPRLEEAAKEYPPSLVIFDPIQSYLGGGVDMSQAEQVRPTLDWLGDYAKRHQSSIVLISHMSKPTKYEAVKKELDGLKAAQLHQQKEDAYRQLLTEANISEKRLNIVMRASRAEIDALELDEAGKIVGADKLMDSIKTEWADFIPVTRTEGATVAHPPVYGYAPSDDEKIANAFKPKI